MKIFCFYLLFCLSFHSFAQSSLNIFQQIPREKIYLNVDKSYYFSGEKITLDVAVVDARTLQNDTLSVPLYLELIDTKKDSLIRRWILKIVDGKINTTIKIPNSLETNYYQLRAYTNWMRNFSINAFPQIDLLVFGQNYKQNIPKEISKSVLTNLKVCPESGISVNGLINNLFVQTTDNFEKGIKSIVKLKSDTTTIRIFDTDENGETLVQFEPEVGKSYYLESEYLKTDIPKSKNEGVIMRGYYVIEAKKLTITVQNNLENIEPLKMVFQTRGNNFFNTLIEPKKIISMNIKTDSFPEGILNVAIIDLEGKMVSQRLFLNVNQDKSPKQNYLLFNSELNSPIESTDKFFTDLKKVNIEMINKKNIIYGFDELEKTAKTKTNFITYKNELGLSVDGRIMDKEVQKAKTPVSVSLMVDSEKIDTLNKKPFFAVLADKKGNFSFENLDFYGDVTLDVKAFLGKKMLKINLKNDSIPSIISTMKPIDWRIFQDTNQQETLQQKFMGVAEDTAKEENLKAKELEEVTVTAKKTLKSPLSMFISEPSGRFLPEQLRVTNLFEDFFKFSVSYRLLKHSNPVVKFFVDDALTPADIVFEMPNNLIAYVDVHDGTSDSYTVGASIMVNIYTIAHRINPMVVKVMDENIKSITFKTQREGYYMSK